MRITMPLLRSAALAAAVASLPALAPSTVQAQGKGHKYGHYKEKGDRNKVRSGDRVADRDDDARDGYYQPGQPARGDRIPPGQRPPSGMCRIWIDGIPAGKQPKATDCATAEANVPPNARVIYGNDAGGEVERSRRGRTTGRAIPGGTIPGGTWPYLSDALAFARGTRTSSVATLVPGATNVRLSSRTVNGVPVEAMFYGSGGQLLEVWRDQDGDGRADRVTEYRNGQVVADYRP